ncbi:hypothetical protein C461_08509 [Halorubrum aidingense JCM 13560]|uniref:DUF58 domain-containing protein n=1 Tax=Halorubrum aidingense JCM 13560 TaxID=1230454 RepID=M0PG37_9EURY|nr:DUF58 domain-containing protein [Halorubrum aidingense]EMA67755.1 hypothetical protein C461_08509 [Halorubrum aidingense JCM 13560]
MATITLTRRGRIAGGVCAVAIVMALAVGTRSLNAVVLPGVVALAAGYYQVARLSDPSVRRTGPADGAVGETREVGLRLYGDTLGEPVSPAFPALVSDRLDDGFAGATGTTGTTGETEPIATTAGASGGVSYAVRYRRRGERRLGPVTVTATDVFGLFERRAVIDEVDTALAYPACRPIPAEFRRRLSAPDALGVGRQREEFDRLREYARGDALRDVHWPSTAKRDEIVVKEFAAETDRGRVSIAGETVGDRAGDDGFAGDDRLATATASLAVALLDDGVPVDVALPAGTVAADPGQRGRRTVLELAARTGPGRVAVEDADVRVVADADGARYELGDRTVDFEALTGTPAHGPAERGERAARNAGGAPGARSVPGAPSADRRATEASGR